jgi:hypothetical protein
MRRSQARLWEGGARPSGPPAPLPPRSLRSPSAGGRGPILRERPSTAALCASMMDSVVAWRPAADGRSSSSRPVGVAPRSPARRAWLHRTSDHPPDSFSCSSAQSHTVERRFNHQSWSGSSRIMASWRRRDLRTFRASRVTRLASAAAKLGARAERGTTPRRRCRTPRASTLACQ